MSWTLLPMDCVVTSFVIEWTNLNGEEQIKWITAPSNVRRYHIFGEFEYETYASVLLLLLQQYLRWKKKINST